jgi:hypothetical protein
MVDKSTFGGLSCFNLFFMEKENTKTALINAFDISEKKKIAEVCRIVGITPSTFYFHYYKDADFRKKVLEKQQDYLTGQIAVAEKLLSHR